MNKALIAIDLDGTLLDKDGRYSLATRDYFRALNRAGHLVVLASGRPFRAMAHIYEDLHCHAPVIAYNGAYVFHPLDETFPVFEAPFSAESIREVYKKTRPFVHSFMAEGKKAIYVDHQDPVLSRYFPYRVLPLIEGPLSETIDEPVFTCLFNSDMEAMGRIKEESESIPGIAWRAWSNSVYSELYVPNAHKGTALAFLIETLGTKKEDVFAFGDAENDIPMLELAGHPFAMRENKVPDLMAGFPHTKNSVTEDGVMDALLAYIKP